MRLPTFSQIGRVMACPSSWLLPRVDREAGEAAQRGTEIHARFYQTITGKEDYAEEFTTAIKWLVGPLGTATVFGEKAIAYDPDEETAIDIGSNVGRAYSGYTGDPFCGATDAFTVYEKSGRVLDLKSGTTQGDLWQLKTQALAVARLHGLTRIDACFYYYDLDEIQHWVWAEDELDGFAEELSQLKKLLLAAPDMAPIAEGEHCKWCPAFSSCPAKVTLARSLAGSVNAVTLPLTAIEAGTAWERLVQCEDLLAKVRDNLEAFARHEPLQLSDGREVRSIEMLREKVNADTAAFVLSQVLDEKGLDRVLTRTTSKKAIFDVLGKEKGAKVIQEIDLNGGIERKKYYQVKAVRR